ncbi:hypothetical protein PAESOLCIP111_03361 [Paenibacillus solanacearum]|uniref:Ger(X)C family spore germination protein n=1 Tax=Paenibacillus solanacearum TaxID=2048548 RepID=A0A916NQW7_9BACL|nr:Ger(x)C family spore germination protein [Paenibacillus solanacearum]CAG7632248.1 hypothetical protein PAESOLCIP111_03361 [Paenibacillus solanacearum]
MIARKLALLFMLPLLLTQAGCWDLKSIQDMNYLTALGVDYKDGRFIVYAQMLDFANVAKQEGPKVSMPASVWSGHVEGETVGAAFDELYRTSQQRVFWGHVTSVVFSESALKRGINAGLDGMLRYNETRYTQWVYGTRMPIDEIFGTTPFFGMSPLASILSQPVENYRQRSYIRPMRLYKLFVELREPGFTLLLPSLTIDKGAWKKDTQADPKLSVNGVFALYEGKLADVLDYGELDGLRWLEDSTVRSPVMLHVNGKPAGKVSIVRPKSRVIPQAQDNEVRVSIRVECKAIVAEILQKFDEAALKKEIAKIVGSQVEHTFAEGKKKGVDVYRIEHALYRDQFKAWSRLTMNGAKQLRDYTLDSVKVDIDLTHSGMYKLKETIRDY